MNALLVWYALVFGCLGVGVYRVTPRHIEQPVKARQLPAWLADAVAYAEPLPDYTDPLFLPDDSQPMELTDAPRAKTTRTH
jgi:hypothetical protein